jgi:alkylated DNA nucleotide flippase Atl1
MQTINRDLNIPYWRTLKADGYLNDKFPSGAESHKALLENGGFKFVRKGKRLSSENYQNYLVRDFQHS